MKDLAPNTPVIVGIGFAKEPSLDPTQCAEPWQLMVRAVRRAAEDAGCERLLTQIESISVPQGMWEYRNPGKLIADALGCSHNAVRLRLFRARERFRQVYLAAAER